jgi:hypothetical protein
MMPGAVYQQAVPGMYAPQPVIYMAAPTQVFNTSDKPAPQPQTIVINAQQQQLQQSNDADAAACAACGACAACLLCCTVM